MADKRRVRRIKQSLSVRFISDTIGGTGRTVDISPGGMLIRSRTILTPGSIIKGSVHLPDHTWMAFEAEVRWAKKIPKEMASHKTSTMGVSFLSVPTEGFYNLLRSVWERSLPHKPIELVSLTPQSSDDLPSR